MLEATAAAWPDRVLAVQDGRDTTLAELHALALAIAGELRAAGVRPGDPVLTMLGNGVHHIALFLGICLAGALHVPVNPESRGPSLVHALKLARPVLAYAGAEAIGRLREAGLGADCAVIEADGWRIPDRHAPCRAEAAPAGPETIRSILFTSGTTGPPKGVQVSERMLIASAAGCALASDCREGDVFLMWEPMHHIGGPQLLVMAMLNGTKLVLVPRFSASGLWPEVRRHGVTKLHYLGGILEILLKARPDPGDRDHPVRLAFGGGCRNEVWKAFESRFAIPIREVYGMTEASSFTTVNVRGVVGSAGTAVPWFDVELLDQDARPVAPGGQGEIVVRSRHSGLFTPGYLDAPEASARLLRDGRLFSGDLGRMDEAGNLRFIGRVTDSLRRRGENISAWEVETALGAHPAIAESAVTGVPATIGEHDILCFVLMKDGEPFDPAALSAWCRETMPPHHVPRYWKQVDGFERTPSQRIRKETLDRDLASAVDTAPARDRVS